MTKEYVIVWTNADAKANDLLRELMAQMQYRWAYRKLNSARMHLIETHTQRVPFDGRSRFVTNGDVTA